MSKEKLLPIGTKVYDPRYGWGDVYRSDYGNIYVYLVHFKNSVVSYNEKGCFGDDDLTPTLSLTEYDYVNGGFTPISEYKEDNKDLTKEFAEILGKLLDCEIIVKQKENL